jgi:cell cycle sensor histidine kinase DivJ
VARVSPQARDLLGLQPELLHGPGFFDRIHVGDRVGYLAALVDVREGASERECELKLRLPSSQTQSMAGNYRHFALRLVRSGSGQVVAFLRDNAAMVEVREQLAEALEDAESNDVAKSRFLASVSHELRTPLNAIIGFSDMMLHGMCGAFEEPRQKEYVGLIRESSHHLLGVVNAILDVSKIESGAYDVTLEHFRFAEAVEMCRDMMALQADAKNIALEARIAASVGEVVADRRSVRQMIINLVSNAIKFTPEGGCVSIAASRVGSLLHFSVSDNGIGIAEGDLARIGRPFTQVQNDYTRQFEGTGLGLSLVKGLVSLHHGAMTIESAPGEGTTVTISLPAEGAVRETEAARAEVRRIEPAGKNGETDGTLRKIA